MGQVALLERPWTDSHSDPVASHCLCADILRLSGLTLIFPKQHFPKFYCSYLHKVDTRFGWHQVFKLNLFIGIHEISLLILPCLISINNVISIVLPRMFVALYSQELHENTLCYNYPHFTLDTHNIYAQAFIKFVQFDHYSVSTVCGVIEIGQCSF